MSTILRRVPQVGENGFPLPWIPKSSSTPTGAAIRSQTSMDSSIPTMMPQVSSTPLINTSSPETTALSAADYQSSTQPGAGTPDSTQISYGHGASNKTLALAVTVPLGVALILGIIAVIVLNRWRKPSRARNNSDSSSKPIWREKFGLLRSNSTSTTSTTSSDGSMISGPISTALHNHPYYSAQPNPVNHQQEHQEQQQQEQRPMEQRQPQSPRTEPGTILFEAPPPPYVQEPAPELPNLPSGLARLSYQHPPPPPTRPVSELRISVQMANALRISAQSIGFPRLGLLPVSEAPPAHPPLPEDLGRWSYPQNQQHQLAAQPHPASPDMDELRNSTLARFPAPPSIPAKSEQRPYTPPLHKLSVPQMQKMHSYRNTSPDLTSPTSPESPIWGHGFPDHPIRPSHSVRSFTSTLYSDTASVHSAHATMGMSARPTPVITQGQAYFGEVHRSASVPH